MADPIQIEVEFTGGERAASGAEQVGRNVGQMGEQAQRAGQRFGQVASSLGQMSGVLGRVSPDMARLGSTLTQVGGAAGALSGAVGPLGVALAAVTTTVGLASAAFERQAQAFATARERAQQLTRSYGELVQAAQAAIQATEQQQRVAQGRGTLAEQRGYTAQAQQQYDLIGRAMSGDEGALAQVRSMGLSFETRTEATATERVGALLGGTGGTGLTMSDREREFLRQRQEALSRTIIERSGLEGGAQAVYEDSGRAGGVTEVERDTDRAMEAARRRGGGGGGRRRRPTLDDLMGGEGDAAGVAEDIANEAKREALALLDTQIEKEREREQARVEQAEAERARMEAEAEAKIEQLDKIEEREEEMARQRAEREREQEDAYQAEVERYSGVTQTIVSGLTDTFVAMATGQKSAEEAAKEMLAGFLQYISQQSALRAAMEFAEAIASFASQRYDSGALHLAAGAGFTAVAVATGVGAAMLVQPPSGAAKPAEPESKGGGGEKGGDVVINWNSPIVTAGTRAELGRTMAQTIRAGEQRFGRA